MDFFEFVLVFSLAFVLPITIFKTVMEHKRKRLEVERGSSEGITVGEVKAMLAEVVREANEPLAARVERLERGALPLHGPDEFYDPDDPAFGDEAERTLGRRVG